MIRINLLRPEKKEFKKVTTAPGIEKEAKAAPPYPALIILLAIVAIAALAITQNNSIKREQNLLDEANREKKSLQHVLIKLKQLEQQKDLFERKIGLIRDLQLRQDVAVTIMDELSRHLPDWVWLTEVAYKEQTIHIQGRAFTNNQIADYIRRLDISPHFDSINLSRSKLKNIRNDQYFEFSLTARYVLPIQEQTPLNKSSAKKEKK